MTPEIGARVRALRKLLDRSQETVASVGGIDRITVVKIEKGDNKLSGFETRTGLAKGLGISLDQLGQLLDGSLSPEDAFKLSSFALSAKAS